MSDRLFALLVGAFIGAGLGIALTTTSLAQCGEELTECRASITCEQQQRALAAYAESLALGLYNADEVP